MLGRQSPERTVRTRATEPHAWRCRPFRKGAHDSGDFLTRAQINHGSRCAWGHLRFSLLSSRPATVLHDFSRCLISCWLVWFGSALASLDKDEMFTCVKFFGFRQSLLTLKHPRGHSVRLRQGTGRPPGEASVGAAGSEPVGGGGPTRACLSSCHQVI